MDRRPFLILVASQKGGVGKTTVALNLSVALIFQKYKVLLVDSDMESASVSEQLGINVEGKGYAEAVRGTEEIQDIVFAYEPIDLHIIPGSPAHEVAKLKPEQQSKFYSKLRKLDYDFIIIDGPPGLFTEEITRYFNDVAIVTTPDPISATTNSRMAAYCQKYKLEHRLLINRAGYSDYDLDKEEVERLFGDVAYQVIPEDKIVEESVIKRKPAYMIDRSSRFSLAIDELAREYALRIGESSESLEAQVERRTPPSFFERLMRWFFGGK